MKGTEAEYVIPLRKEVMKAPKYQRTKKAMIAVREFLQHHTKSKNVFIGKHLNEKIQENGRKNVVPRIKVKVVKDEEKYKAELIGFPIILDKDKEPKEGKKSKKDAKKENLDTKKETDIKKGEDLVEHEKLEKPIIPQEPLKVAKKENQEKERQKEIISKTQKPKHEKKK